MHSAQLLTQYCAIQRKPALFTADRNLKSVDLRTRLRSDGGYDRGAARSVTGVILDDEYGPPTCLLGPQA